MPRNTTSTHARYTLQELTSATGVTPRTVRYYVSEGLLPPPVAAGPRSYYTETHLQRLRLIVHLKDTYLPLREIRRRPQELSDDDIAGAIAELENTSHPPVSRPETAVEETGTDDLVRMDSAILDEPAEPVSPESLHPQTWPFVDTPPQRSQEPVRPEPAWRLPRPVRSSTSEMQRGSIWRKLEIGDSAEFLIEERLYQRRKEQVDALIAWAQRILETSS